MKLRVGDQVLVTAGKSKGLKAKVIRVLPKEDRVVVEGANLYVKHIKPIQGREGQRVHRPRPLPTANVAILNGEGKVDRIGYKVSKDGSKVRVFKKSGKEVPTPTKATKN